MDFLTIDPGVNLGYALVSKEGWKESGYIRAKGKTFEERVESILTVFYSEILHTFTGKKVYIEYPSYQNLVAQNTQSIVKLAYLVGRIYGLCETYGFKPQLIKVSSWRGTCPKEVLWRRAEKYFRIKRKLVNHEGDAVAIAHWLLTTKQI